MKISFKWHVILFGLFSLIYVVANNIVKIEGFPLTVQFGEYNFEKTISLFENSDGVFGMNRLLLFRMIFVIDFIWAPLFLTLLYRLIKRYFHVKKSITMLFFIGMALLFDYWENVIYVNANLPKLGLELTLIEAVKIGFYALVLIVFLFYAFKYLIDYNYRLLKYGFGLTGAFLKYNFLSLFIIALILALLTQMDQGATVMVDLLMRPVNLFFMFLLFFFLAIVLSHYPSYFRAILHDDQTCIRWNMQEFILKKYLGLGLVFFQSEDKRFRERNNLKMMRHSIGLAVLSAFIYIILFVGNNFSILPKILVPELAFIIFIVSVIAYANFKRKGVSHQFLAIVFGVTAVLVILSCSMSFIQGWSFATTLLSILTIIGLKLLYIVFRIRRQATINNVNFIKTIASVGFFTLIFLVFINFYVEVAVAFVNPLLIILIYIINFYGLLMLVLKHMFFYWDNQNLMQPIRQKFNVYRYLIPTIVLTFIIWSFFIAPGIPSDLHRLQTYAVEKATKVKETEFLMKLHNNQQDANGCFFQVASYGGGLKANLWTLLVLNQINNHYPDFVDHTISMSGTSGGMLGIGNYAALYAKNKDKNDSIWQANIRAIGNLNHLAVDITYLFGADLFRELLPFDHMHNGTDRSAKSMEFYADLLGFRNDLRQPYQALFKEIYETSGYFPPLLINTFATSGTQGVGLSIESNYKAPGAINIVNDHKQITYFGAMSTSNRFPIFSPTANIKNKGHFLDGGYFDNSGLTSTLAFRSYVLKSIITNSKRYPRLQNINEKDIKTIIINSSKTDYIKSLFNRYVIQGSGIREDAVGEISAIITGITGLDKVPSYFEGVVQDTVHFFLPQPFDYQDVVTAYDGEPRMDPAMLTKIIAIENAKIEEALQTFKGYELSRWGTVAPALARLNSEPAVQYQFAMAYNHKAILNALNKVTIHK